MTPEQRRRFDRQLERVLDDLPAMVLELLDQVPLVVEDHPSRRQMEELEVECRDELCGLYDGIPLTERSIELSGTLPDQVTIFREGILRAASDDQGRIRGDELRRQIRITILHEVGHHFGLDEDDLREAGYE
jgi:predicted Zn-dependent protease with MMP-like domain